VVFLNALSGSAAYMVQGRVLCRMGLRSQLPQYPGPSGGVVVQYLDSRWFSMLFGVFLLLIAAFLHRGRQLPVVRQRDAHVSSESLQAFRSPYMRLGIVISFLVGVISSLFGIGGGIIHVPFLIVILGIPVHAATATSHFVLAITSLTGTLAFLEAWPSPAARGGSMDWGFCWRNSGPSLYAAAERSHPSDPGSCAGGFRVVDSADRVVAAKRKTANEAHEHEQVGAGLG
jgi:uncharacterized membrane protein YfcA